MIKEDERALHRTNLKLKKDYFPSTSYPNYLFQLTFYIFKIYLFSNIFQKIDLNFNFKANTVGKRFNFK